MRILLLIAHFPPDVDSTGVLMRQVCEGLVDEGHDVSVITTFPHYEKFKVWDQYRGKVAQRSELSGMDVLRLYVLTPGKKRRMVNRLVSYVSFNTLAAFANLLSRRAYDVILCTNSSFFTGMSAYLAGKGIPFVYNVQDLYPETLVRNGVLRNRPAIAALKQIERFMYNRAAHVTVIAPSVRDNLVSRGIPADKVSVIPNFVDADYMRPLPRDNNFGRAHDLNDRFVVTHAANRGHASDLETLLDTALLLASQQDILFLVVGADAAKPDLEQKARQLGLDNVRFLPYQPREKLPWVLASSDVCLSLYPRGTAHRVMPSRIYEILASGRPLLASAEPDNDIAKLLESAQCGICTEPESPIQLAGAILRLYHDTECREAMGKRGRQHAEQNFSRETVVGRYSQLLQSVVERSGVGSGREVGFRI